LEERVPLATFAMLRFAPRCIPVSTIVENYDDFVAGGYTPDEALAETLECYPNAGADTIRRCCVTEPPTNLSRNGHCGYEAVEEVKV